MNNYPYLYSSLQSINSILQTPPAPTPVTPSTVTWNFPQPMQVQITTPLNPNHDYQVVAKDFLEKYVTAISIGVVTIGHFYDANTSISLHIHRGNENHLFEIVGHNNFRNKLVEFGIQTIKYSNVVYTTQPVGKNSILITMHGRADINGVTYTTINTFIIRITSGLPRIINQVLEIFM
ncbi:putative orfan [Tupanvirus soda lake]|uniref:Orfan n=2 Tax=Tupanvirus TaxID=2094720 RepID=A0AC62ABK4_9VIRU|nr:putative orfan [Tupanvirus soda lake]QKU35025.1 putative orfan [Tupanvirus soda lake]